MSSDISIARSVLSVFEDILDAHESHDERKSSLLHVNIKEILDEMSEHYSLPSVLERSEGLLADLDELLETEDLEAASEDTFRSLDRLCRPLAGLAAV